LESIVGSGGPFAQKDLAACECQADAHGSDEADLMARRVELQGMYGQPDYSGIAQGQTRNA
jgi:hypothetical protein